MIFLKFKYNIQVFSFAVFAFCLQACTTQAPLVEEAKGGEENPDFAQYIAAVNEKVSGNFEAAAKLFEDYLQKNPKSADAYYNLSGIYDAQNRTTKALECSRKACELDKTNKWYLLQKAYLLQRNFDYKETVVTYQELIKLDGENADFYFALADAQVRNNQVDGAIETLNKAEKKLGTSFEITYEKYRVYTMAGKYDKAIVELEKISQENPGEARIYGMLGELYEQTGNSQKALEMFEKILKSEPDNGNVHLSLFQYYLKQKNDAKALEELKKAFESPNVEVDTKMRVMLDYFERSERRPELRPEAYDLLNLMEKAHPGDAKTYSIYADFLFRDNKVREARDKYRKAVEIEKDKFVIWNQLILLDAQLNDKVALNEDSKQAKELFPTQAGFYFYYGLSCNQLKKYNEAVEALTEGVNLVLDNDQLMVEFYQGLGEAYNYLGKHSESDENYEKALKINPDNAYALNNYSYYLSLRKEKLDKAAAMSKRSNELVKDNPSFMDTYGWILFQTKQYEEAEKWIMKAILSDDGQNGTLFEHYGDVLFQLNRKSEALEYWNKAKAAGDYSKQLDQKIKEGKYVE
ncbi:MAG TPA: tetratricopeptide repeat protein [Flavobacteriales bacterium]|nr:tetratricopeptide repeat protein [Flavobacteriales bacterium]